MAFALSSSSLKSFTVLQSLPHTHQLFPMPSTLLLPHHCLSNSVLAFSRRRNRNSQTSSLSSSKPKNKKSSSIEEEDEEMDGDAFEALFNMLEEDLKNDKGLASIDDDDISEKDFEKLQRELEAALGIADDDVDVELLSSDVQPADYNIEDDDAADEEEERPVLLKNWQMRRLARALKNGKRKTSIKSLAAELCLDRSFVLELLRDPPPNLVMMSAALRDEPESTPLINKAKPIELIPVETSTANDVKSESEKKLPVHVMRHNWTAQKRLKKVHIETLERVYKRTKRPTNAMVSSIVQVTNLPRKRVVKWFEDKRNENGVPEQRLPYQRKIHVFRKSIIEATVEKQRIDFHL